MKHIYKIASLFIIGCLVLTSCVKNAPESKYISPKDIKISGQHKDLLAVADSAKVLLTCTDEKNDKWDVRVIIPLVNTKLWKNVPGKKPTIIPRHGYTYFEPQMGNLQAEYLDENKSPLSFEVGVDWDVIQSLLSSGDTKTPEDFILKSRWENLGDHSYKKMKSIYDKVAMISITKADLDEVEMFGGTSETKSIYESYEEAINRAASEIEDAISSYGDLLDDF